MSTLISWTDETWNPVTGCSKVSPGCTFCYAEAISHRFKRTTLPWADKHAAENVVCHEDRLAKPLSWRKPRRVFVNSVSDLFHEQVPEGFIRRIFAVMQATPQNTYQILTKRAARMREMLSRWYDFRDGWGVEPLANVWLGVSVEDQERADERIPELLRTPAAVRFLSCEPLLGPVEFSDVTGRSDAVKQLGKPALSGIDWVIAGGESGSHMSHHPERWMDHAWARAIRDQCVAVGVAYFFKQSSGPRTETGTALEEEDGSRWSWRQYPGELTAPVRVEEP